MAAPTTPYATVAHGDFKYVGYTGVYNVVDYSATSFPCGVSVDKSKDQYTADYKSQSEYCQAAYDSCKFDTERSDDHSANGLDNGELLHGLPVSLQ